MTTQIKCPHCGKLFEPSEAFKHELEEKLSAESQEQIDKLKKRVEDAEGAELKIRKEKLELQEAKEKFELEKQRQLDEEREKIVKTATEKVEEKDKFKFAEYEKKLRDMSEALKVAQTKGEQGSQQLQGEVLELDLEKALAAAYTDDEIVEVGKGAQGGDIIQKVKGRSGRMAGIILWETKRAKWQPSWKAKLSEDARKADASIAVLVSTNLPGDVDNFKLERGVIICSHRYALPLAGVLRRSILQIAVAKQTAENKDENLEMVYQYLSGNGEKIDGKKLEAPGDAN